MSAGRIAGFDLEARIADRGRACGLELDVNVVDAIAVHARAVLEHNERLHLTSVTEPEVFLERHIGESLEGAAMVDPRAAGRLVDLGSGNGYPAIPLAAVRGGLQPVCVEASEGKASFLRDALNSSLGKGVVWNRQVQRPTDFEDDTPVRILTSRGMGNWERLFPRIATMLAPDGVAMLWAGDAVRQIASRESWRRLDLVARHALPGRRSSWIWCFRARRGTD